MPQDPAASRAGAQSPWWAMPGPPPRRGQGPGAATGAFCAWRTVGARGCVTPHHSSTSPMGWGEPGGAAVTWQPSLASGRSTVPALARRAAPEQRAFLAGDSSDLLGSWHRRQRSTQGCPCPPRAVKGAATPRSGGDICMGQRRGVCIQLDKSSPSLTARLQPQESQLVQEGPSSRRGWDRELRRHGAEQVWGVEQHR